MAKEPALKAKAKPKAPPPPRPKERLEPGPELKPAPKAGFKLDWYLIGLAFIILGAALIRIRLVDIPLERDEGEYAYIGRLMMDGIAPYKAVYNMKLPGTYGMYALIMSAFGKTASGIHYGLTLINAATIAFFFFGLRRLFSPSVALFTAGVYAIMSVSAHFLGFAAHATHFVTFFVSIALFFLSRFYTYKTIGSAFLTGLLFGLAFLMKQQAVFFMLFGGLAIILLTVQKSLRLPLILSRSVAYGIGAVIPYLLTVLVLYSAGAFDKFWFWTVTYASKYAAGVDYETGKTLFSSSFGPMWREFGAFWVLCFAGIVLTFLTRFSLQQKLLAILFAVFAFLTVCPGFYFRQHYFITFIPAIGLMGAMSLEAITGFLQRSVKTPSLAIVSFIVLCLVSFTAISREEDYYLSAEPSELSQTIYKSNPFVESVEIAKYIQAHTDKNDKIAILGSEPQILLYSDRNSATGHIYMYGLMELQPYNVKMQQEMIAELERNKPKYLVFCGINFSWLIRKESPRLILDWYDKTIQSGTYDIAGVVDLQRDQPTIYKWDEAARTYPPKGPNLIYIFKRK